MAAATFLLPAPGAYALAATDVPWLGAISIGVTLGAELDLLAFMCSRYFGVHRFGLMYGVIFAGFMLGSAAGPYTMGAAFEGLGSYVPALQLFAVLLLAASALMLTLGPYRFAVRS